MRIGGGIERHYENPEQWLELVQELGFDTVYAPIDHTAAQSVKAEYKKLMQQHDIVLGEVGAWVNPLSSRDEERKKNIAYCQKQLAFADEMNARCCVNIVGSCGEIWDGAYPDNFSADIYVFIVDSIREIIDGAKPKHTFYTIEPMPWMIPNTPETYLKLIEDVGRDAFAVHLDYTNMICSPTLYLNSSDFIRKCFQILGKYIKSIHAKDILMENHLPCVIREVIPGAGSIDYNLVMRLARQVNQDMTIFAEHLSSWREYEEAGKYLRKAERGKE